jgi:hypothetical protein
MYENLKAIEFINIDQKREKFIESLPKYDYLKGLNLEKIRQLYSKVIPKISASNKLAPLKYREYLNNFKFLAL